MAIVRTLLARMDAGDTKKLFNLNINFIMKGIDQMKTHIFTIQRMQTPPTMKNECFIFNVISNLSFYHVPE